MAQARGDVGEAQAVQQLAHAALVQGDAEQLGDPRLDVRAPPPDNLVCLQIRPFAYPARDLALLLGRQPPRHPAAVPVGKAGHPVGVVAVNPVAQGLAVHASQPRRVLALAPVQHQRQRKQPTGHGRVVRPSRKPPQVSRSVFRPRDPNRHASLHHHGSNPDHTVPSRTYSRSSQSKRRLVLYG